MAGFDPFACAVVNPNNPNIVRSIDFDQDPEKLFLQQIRSLVSSPRWIIHLEDSTPVATVSQVH